MFASLALLALLHQTPPVKTVAAPTWSTVQTPPELAAFYSEHLAQALRHEGLKVITATEMTAVLTAQRQLQLLGCTGDGTSCMTELANALGADLTLMGSIAKLDETLEVHLKIISSTTGAVLVETNVSAVGQRALLEELDGAAARLASDLRGSGGRAKSGPHTLRFWSLIPGVLGVAGVGTGTYFLVNAGSTYRALYNSLHTPADASGGTQVDLASSGKQQQLGGWISVGIGAAALVVCAVLILFGGSPP